MVGPIKHTQTEGQSAQVIGSKNPGTTLEPNNTITLFLECKRTTK